MRLHDNPALARSIARCQRDGLALLPVAWHGPSAAVTTRWGFERVGVHRQAFRAQALAGLARRLQALGSDLLILQDVSAQALVEWSQRSGAVGLVGQAIHAPEEQAEVAALQAQGLQVEAVEQGGLFNDAQLPWVPEAVPNVFTAFRQGVERMGLQPAAPLPVPPALPAWPAAVPRPAPETAVALPAGARDERSAFPYALPDWPGDETSALNHLRAYLASDRPRTYKATRNALTGRDFASHWSPWLASGSLSVRQAVAELRAMEAKQGASDGSYWLWFELLWREHFRCMLRRHGNAMFRAQGLGPTVPQPVAYNTQGLTRWRQGRTGLALVDAAMRELHHTGYLSNRLRQVAASALIHELRGDWRAGAAWFEHCLIDFDVHSNQGNWAYIAGVGTDPRGGRHFNVDKQAREHDPDGAYCRRWAGAG